MAEFACWSWHLKTVKNTSSVALYKKLCSNSAIQGNRVHFTALRVVYREVISQVFWFSSFQNPGCYTEQTEVVVALWSLCWRKSGRCSDQGAAPVLQALQGLRLLQVLRETCTYSRAEGGQHQPHHSHLPGQRLTHIHLRHRLKPVLAKEFFFLFFFF